MACDAMAAMARDWPFFAAMIDDVEMLMAKSDLDIFERYSRLSGDLHGAFFPGIADEFARTREAILALKDRDELLADDYRLRLSIRLRNPYVDPISLLQVDLLRRWRAGGREDDATLRALVATVNGIAARHPEHGLRRARSILQAQGGRSAPDGMSTRRTLGALPVGRWPRRWIDARMVRRNGCPDSRGCFHARGIGNALCCCAHHRTRTAGG